jgi:hypothetical protein
VWKDLRGQHLRLAAWRAVRPAAEEEGAGHRRDPFRAREAGEEGLPWLQRGSEGEAEMAKGGKMPGYGAMLGFGRWTGLGSKEIEPAAVLGLADI